MTIHQFIKSQREKTGKSLRDIAGACDVAPAYLSRVENGIVPPSDQLLEKLALVLDTSLDELLLLAGRLPAALRTLIEREPDRASYALSSLAAMMVAEPTVPYGASEMQGPGLRAIENGFPFEDLSEVAEIESWRKEVYRPVYHVHKWWAQRLGSVFRGVVLGATQPQGSQIMRLFYQPIKLPAPVVFDPFMGSGTTLGEAHKLGCTVIGRDINPVAWRGVRTALGPMSRKRLVELYERLEATVGKEISALYRAIDAQGRPCDVLYSFWVKVLPCPGCKASVDLFSSYVFASHAYPKKYPQVQVVCPGCGDVFASHYEATNTTCPSCKHYFDQQKGPAERISASCRACGHSFPIAKTARAAGHPPAHRLYAKLVLQADGEKAYLRATAADIAAVEAASRRLAELAPPLPTVDIQDGHNTSQVLGYGYRRWDQMFGDRQLLALSMLAQGIRALPACPERDALMMLFSGVLEFNNLFASYKGEGTGAVRHMFAHHVLKPERTPLEAHVWGTPKSSGSFSNLFKSRLLRAVEYRDAPFEVRVTEEGGKKEGVKVFGLSAPMGGPLVDAWPAGGLPPRSVYLSCGSSAATDLPSGVVDLVATDPPFFDNVHYSELADFFHVWQRLYFDGASDLPGTTRNPGEVQDTDPSAFGEKLKAVFVECHRVLKDEGLLVFSYHHSRDDGWSSVAHAVLGAGFSVVAAQPVKAEMSVAMPKSQAKEPIDLDILLVCRKRRSDDRPLQSPDVAAESAQAITADKVRRFNRMGRMLSRNDVLIVFLSQLLVELSAGRKEADVIAAFNPYLTILRDVVERVHARQSRSAPPPVEKAQVGLPFLAAGTAG